MTPEELVAIIDFRYLTDAITPDEALAIFRKAEPGKAERIADAQGRRLSLLHHLRGLARLCQREAAPPCHEAVDAGFNHIKMKVGRDLDDDIRRLEDRARGHGPRPLS